MALGVVQSAGAKAANMLTVVVGPITTTAGNLLHAGIGIYSAAGLYSSIANTGLDTWAAGVAAFVGGSSVSSNQTRYAKNINGSAADTITLTLNGLGYPTLSIIEISGADTSSPLDLHESGTASGTSTPSFTTSGSTAVANEISIGEIGNSAGLGINLTPVAGYTETYDDFTSGFCGLEQAYKIVSVTGTQTYSATASLSPDWSMCITTYKQASGGGGNVVSGAANDNADAASGSVKVAVKASGGATETKDASAGSVKVAVKVSSGATEGADASAGSVKVAVKISGGVTETPDASAGNLTASAGYHISGGASEGADAASGSLKVAVHISGGATEGADSSAGNIVATSRTISGGATESADAAAGSLHNANPLPLPIQQGMGPGWNLFHHQPARVREHDSVEDHIRAALAKAEEAQSPKAKRQAVKELRGVVGDAVAKADDSFRATAQTLERAMRLEMSASAFLRNVSDALERQRIQDNDDMEAFMIIAELAA